MPERFVCTLVRKGAISFSEDDRSTTTTLPLCDFTQSEPRSVLRRLERTRRAVRNETPLSAHSNLTKLTAESVDSQTENCTRFAPTDAKLARKHVDTPATAHSSHMPATTRLSVMVQRSQAAKLAR